MKKIVCIYTAGGGMPQMIENTFGHALGELSFVHISDSSLMRDLISAGGMTAELDKRLSKLFDAAAAIEPDLILCTCSSIGEAAERAQAMHPEVKVLRIDEAMALYAAENYEHIGVLATVSTTLGPSCRLIERLAAELNRTVSISSATAAEAFPLLLRGEREQALACIKAEAIKLSRDVDVLLLAQASMGAFAEDLAAVTGLPVYGSPELCAEQVKTMLL